MPYLITTTTRTGRTISATERDFTRRAVETLEEARIGPLRGDPSERQSL